MLNAPHYSDRDFFKNFLVEAHGILLDILVFGVLILLLNWRGDKRAEVRSKDREKKFLIANNKNEIEDCRRWFEPEAMHKIVGNIYRLRNLGLTRLNLNACFLCGANLFAVRLQRSNFDYANLSDAFLEGAKLNCASFKRTTLRFVRLSQADFGSADLRGADFAGARLDGANFKGARYSSSTVFPGGFFAQHQHSMISVDEDNTPINPPRKTTFKILTADKLSSYHLPC